MKTSKTKVERPSESIIVARPDISKVFEKNLQRIEIFEKELPEVKKALRLLKDKMSDDLFKVLLKFV